MTRERDERHESGEVEPGSERAGIGRRELIAGAGALAGLAASGSAWAGSHGDAHAGHGEASGRKYFPAKSPKAHPKLVAAANACLETGRACFSHCLDTFRAGDTTMADCAWSVEQMMHVCRAFEALASYDSTHLKAMAPVCAKVCEECERECRVHEEHQEECRRCADACAALIREIEALLA